MMLWLAITPAVWGLVRVAAEVITPQLGRTQARRQAVTLPSSTPLAPDLVDAVCDDAIIMMRLRPVSVKTATYLACCVHDVPVACVQPIAQGVERALADTLGNG